MEPTTKVGHGHDRREAVNSRSFPRYPALSAVDARSRQLSQTKS
jgi:hypothetical protein